MAKENPKPIVIAGGGCVGLYLALLLAQSSIASKILIIEPSPTSSRDTKAMAHQPYIFPHFARAPKLMPALSAAGVFSRGICFRTSAAKDSKVLAAKHFKEGEMGQLLLPQWKFQEILKEMVVQAGGEIREGWIVSGFEDLGGSVGVRIEEVHGNGREAIEASYLVGADGARSAIRKALDIPFEGETLDAQLVATDIVYPFDEYGFLDANFVIDEMDYGLIGRIDRTGLWRMSYGVPGNMTDEDIQRGLAEKVERMLPGEAPFEYEIKRVAPYKAQQRCAREFWRGRVGLIGDAAHLTNPYAGLGLSTGIMDASSLADVLESVIERGAPERLLLEWAESRKLKFQHFADPMSRAAFSRVKASDPEALLEKDPMLKAMKANKPIPPPSLSTNAKELKGFV